MSGLEIVVVGAGGHASVVIDLARTAGYAVIGCVSPEHPSFDAEFCPYLGTDDVLATLAQRSVAAAIGIGSVTTPVGRIRVFEMLRAAGFDLPPLRHPSSVVAQSAKLGAGTQIMAKAVIQPLAQIAANVIVNTGAVVEHHAHIGDHVHVAPGAVLCGNVIVGDRCHIGANATVLQNVTLGPRTIVGAGAVVTRDAPGGSVLKGCPAQ